MLDRYRFVAEKSPDTCKAAWGKLCACYSSLLLLAICFYSKREIPTRWNITLEKNKKIRHLAMYFCMFYYDKFQIEFWLTEPFRVPLWSFPCGVFSAISCFYVCFALYLCRAWFCWFDWKGFTYTGFERCVWQFYHSEGPCVVDRTKNPLPTTDNLHCYRTHTIKVWYHAHTHTMKCNYHKHIPWKGDITYTPWKRLLSHTPWKRDQTHTHTHTRINTHHESVIVITHNESVSQTPI